MGVVRMPRKGFRWELIALSAVLTLAVLSLAYYSYESMGVKRPLERTLLMDADVSAVEMRTERGGEVIEVTLSKVADLRATYSRIHSLVSDRMGSGAFTLDLKDKGDASLEDMYYSVHYYLEEASVRGNFGAMIEACEPILEGAGASDYRITVDRDRIYVQIESAGGYLYKVLERVPGWEGGGVTQ